ncbi:MAG: DUF1992 domain-containing protein [Anaerolineae bacterium]|nr:DUF1992 domain-containing protein [Anaerolineae bacterium]
MSLDDLIGGQIEEAMARGEFDNLRGRGKPFAWQENPFVDPSKERAYQLLKDNDYAPRWIEERKALLAAAPQLRATLQQAYRYYQITQDIGYWQRQVERFKRDAAAHNQKIRTYNLIAPTPAQHLFPCDIDEEIRRVSSEQ